MRKACLCVIGLLMVAGLATPAHTQAPRATRLALEVRGGYAFPIGDFSSFARGRTLAGSATIYLTPLLGIYGGYTQNRFKLDERADSVGVEYDAADDGFGAGIRLSAPNPQMAIDPYLRAGLVFRKLRLEPSVAGVLIESDRSRGFEAGLGVGIGLGWNLVLTPEVVYTNYVPNFDGREFSFAVEHLRADLGLRLRL